MANLSVLTTKPVYMRSKSASRSPLAPFGYYRLPRRVNSPNLLSRSRRYNLKCFVMMIEELGSAFAESCILGLLGFTRQYIRTCMHRSYPARVVFL